MADLNRTRDPDPSTPTVPKMPDSVEHPHVPPKSPTQPPPQVQQPGAPIREGDPRR